jgi:hypothetical protein
MVHKNGLWGRKAKAGWNGKKLKLSTSKVCTQIRYSNLINMKILQIFSGHKIINIYKQS